MNRIGVIGCGDVSRWYLRNADLFPGLTYVACASRQFARAQAQAQAFGLQALSVEALLERDDIDIVLNLTSPAAHAEITLAALEAGKHVYVEKPLASNLVDAVKMLDIASRRNRRIGVAPDTVLGPAIHTARTLIDTGAIGDVLFGSAATISRGSEHRHPDPAFLYQSGAGPVLDVGPYSLAALTTLLGPVASVCAIGSIGAAQRTVTARQSQNFGQAITVEVLTTVQALLLFASGVQATFTTSWDGIAFGGPSIELYGAGGSIKLPDPNWFGGTLHLTRGDGTVVTLQTDTQFLGQPNRRLSTGDNVADYRGIGLAEMAQAIGAERPHRCSADHAFHVLEVSEAMLVSAERSGMRIPITSRGERPAPLSQDEASTLLRPAGTTRSNATPNS